MRSKLVIFAVIFATAISSSESQKFPTCRSSGYEIYPHPTDCEKYLLCKDGTQEQVDCDSGEHFSPKDKTCMDPSAAKCHRDYWCQTSNSKKSIFIADSTNCKNYYRCVQGEPILFQCEAGLWWDVSDKRCIESDEVECDPRALVNPNNPLHYDLTTSTTTTTTTQKPIKDTLYVGECLNADGHIDSLNKCFRTIYQGDGNFVSYRLSSSKDIWASNTARTCPNHACVQHDGNLVVYDCNGSARWASNTVGHHNARLIMQNDGNLVLYNTHNTPLWSSNTVTHC